MELEVDECCYECANNDNQSVLLICDSCGFYCCHTYCCNPPLDIIPEEDWFCKYCSQSFQRSNRRNNTNNGQNHSLQGANNRSALPPRLTRSSARHGQSLLEHLFLMSDDAILNEVPSPLTEEDEEEEEEALFDDSQEELRQNHNSNSHRNRTQNHRTRRQGNRANRRGGEPVNTRTSRNTRSNAAINSNSDLEDFSFSNNDSRRYPARTRRNLFNSRMNVEDFGRNENILSVDDLSRFSYPLRSRGRDS